MLLRISRIVRKGKSREIQIINSRCSDITKNTNEYYNKLINEIDETKAKLEDVRMTINQAERDLHVKYDRMTSQFITILGIFAAILMGAFGSIQAFTSMFNNIYQVSVGELLIVSALGALAIIWILFILFNSISKMTGSNLSSCKCHKPVIKVGSEGLINGIGSKVLDANSRSIENKCNCSPWEKHPTLIASHYVFLVVFLSGGVLEILRLSQVGIFFIANVIGLIITIIVILGITFGTVKYIHGKLRTRSLE